MRQHPIGTGPFKFVEFKPNESIRLTRNPDYWKPGRPYLDGIEYTIIPNRSTAILAFTAGKFDLTFPYEVTVPLMKDVKSQAPQAICELVPSNASTNLLVNREVPPFDNPELRRALASALDRKSFIDILAEGQGKKTCKKGRGEPSGFRKSRRSSTVETPRHAEGNGRRLDFCEPGRMSAKGREVTSRAPPDPQKSVA
jgi:ABC-type transport system substrate-binding protein